MLMNMNVNAVQAAAVGAASSTTTVQAGGVAASPAQKVLAPRMILSSQIIGARPGQPGEEEYQSEFSEFLMLSYKHQSVSDKSQDGQEEQVVCGGGGDGGIDGDDTRRSRRTITTILPAVSSAASVVSDDDGGDNNSPSFPPFPGSNQSEAQESSSVTELTCDIESEVVGVDEDNEKNSWTSSLPPPASPPMFSSKINSELCSLPESDLKGCDIEEANSNSQSIIMSASDAPSLPAITVPTEPANDECGDAGDPGGDDAGTAAGGSQDEEEEEDDDTSDLFLEGDSLSEIVNSSLGNVDDKCDDEASSACLFQSNAADDDFSKSSSPFHCVQQVAPPCESSESALPESITLYDNNNSEEDLHDVDDQSGIITNSVTCMRGNGGGGVDDDGGESPFLDSSGSYHHHPLHNDNNNNNGAYPQTPKGPDVDSKESNLLISSDSSCIIVRNNKIMSGGGEEDESSPLKCGSVSEDRSSRVPFQPQQQEPAQGFHSSSINKQSNNLVRDLMMSSLGSDLFSTSETDIPFSNGAIIINNNSRSPSSSLSGSHNQNALPHDFPSSASSPNIRYAPMLSSCNTDNSSQSVPPNRKHSVSSSSTSPVRIPPHSFQYQESSPFPMHNSPSSAGNPVGAHPKAIINNSNNVTSPDYRAPRCFTNDAQLHSQFVHYNQQHPLGAQDGQQQQHHRDYGNESRKAVGQDVLLQQQTTFPEQPLIPYNSQNYMSIPSNVPGSSGEHNNGSRIHSSSSIIAQGCLPPDGSSPTSTSSSSYPSQPNVPVAHSVLVSSGGLYPSPSSGSFSFGPNPNHQLQESSSSSPHVSFGVNRGGHSMSVVQQGGSVKIPPSSPSSSASHHNNGAPPMLSPPMPRFPMSHPRHGHPPPHSPGGGSSFGMPPPPRWMTMSPTNGPHGEQVYPPGSSYGHHQQHHQNITTMMRGDSFPAGAIRISSNSNIRTVPKNSNLAYRMPYETYPNDGRHPGRPNFPTVKGGGYAPNHPQNVIIGRNNRNNNSANSNSNSRVQSMNIRIGGGGYGNFGPPDSIYRSGQGPQFSGGHHPHLQQQQQHHHQHLHEAQSQYYSHAQQQQQSSSVSAAPSLCSSSGSNNNSGSTSNNSVSVNSSSGGSVGHTTYPLVCRVSPIRSRYEDPSSSSSSHHHHPQFSVPPYSQHGGGGLPTPHHLQHQHAQRPPPPAAFRGGGAYSQDSYSNNNVTNNPYHHHQHPGAHHHPPPPHHHHHLAAPPTTMVASSSSGRSGRLLMMMGDYNTYPYESQYNNKDDHHGDDDDEEARSLRTMTAETAKMKCKNFLSFLLELSAKQNATVARNVKTLIQGLVDGKVNAEDFSERLQKEVNSQPQPCLVGFLKKSLPHLRQSLATRELTIDGIRAPSLSSIGPTAPVTALIPSNQQVRPQVMPTPVRIITPINSASSPVAASTTNNNAPIPRTTVAAVQQRFATPSKSSALAGKGGASGKSSAASNATSASSLSSNVVSSSTTTKSSGPSSSKSSSKEKDKKGIGAAAYSGYGGDDDINDVAAMGGVNLAEESQRILGSTEFVGTQIRSCKDETFLPAMLLQSRIRATAGKFGIEDVAPEVAAMISHATEERLKNLLEKLSVIAEHRLDVIKADERYEVSQDVKGQLRFLEELNKLERKRHDEQEREILIKAAKSRSKSEDPEQAKLKAKAKEMQRVALEEMRQREANLTALQAIGPRKKPRLDSPAGSQSTMAQTPLGGQGASNSLSRPQIGLRPRLKRVNLRDLLFLMEQDKETQRSHFLYKNLLLK